MPAPDRALLLTNFVATMDGVVSYAIPGRSGGGPIAGASIEDRFVMGLLRATSDAIVVGAGTARSLPHHLWTPEHAYPLGAEAFDRLRRRLGKPPLPLTVLVSGSGDLDPRISALQHPEVPTIVLVGPGPDAQHRAQLASGGAEVVQLKGPGRPPAAAILEAIRSKVGSGIVLTEGGPSLLSTFIADDLVDEIFLTLSPFVAGRDRFSQRPTLVTDIAFSPDEAPRWQLLSLKKAFDHLFLRYRRHRRSAEVG